MTHDKMKEEAQALNTAFVEAFVAYSAYDSRRWMIKKEEAISTVEGTQVFGNPVLRALQKANSTPETLSTKKAFEMYASIFAKNKFEPVALDLPAEFNYTSEKYGFQTTAHSATGDYEALNNLARASIVRSKNPDDTYTLHLSFRGTDTDARTFKTFVTDAYLDMSAYYDSFKPLEKAILEYAAQPENKISKINVSGHSLGGAMVPEFFQSPEVKACSIPLEGVTFGAPGNKKKALYSIFPALYHGIKTGKFQGVAEALKDVLKETFTISGPDNSDSRITQYSHVGDLIPKAGSLIYHTVGKEVSLEDVASNNVQQSMMLTGKPPISFMAQKAPSAQAKNAVKQGFDYQPANVFAKVKDVFKKAITFQYHDMLRYIINVDHHVQKMVNTVESNPELKSAMTDAIPDLIEFNKYKQRFDRVANVKQFGEMVMRPDSQEKGLPTLPKELNLPTRKKENSVQSKMLALRQKAFAEVVVEDLGKKFHA